MALGLRLEVYCPGCYTRKAIEIGERLASSRSNRVRFTCSRITYRGTPCQSRGQLHLYPVEPMKPELTLVSMGCGRCLPPWFAEDVQLERPPWALAPIDARSERYRCPGCGGQVRATFHGKPGRRDPAGLAGHILGPRRSLTTAEAPTAISEQFYPVPFF